MNKHITKIAKKNSKIFKSQKTTLNYKQNALCFVILGWHCLHSILYGIMASNNNDYYVSNDEVGQRRQLIMLSLYLKLYHLLHSSLH